MTFFKAHFRLTRALAPRDLEKFTGLSSVYGIRGLAIDRNELVVEYDASRMHEAEALAALRQAGLPVAPSHPISAGAFDSTGEFKDFAWPITGLSPANQKQK